MKLTKARCLRSNQPIQFPTVNHLFLRTKHSRWRKPTHLNQSFDPDLHLHVSERHKHNQLKTCSALTIQLLPSSALFASISVHKFPASSCLPAPNAYANSFTSVTVPGFNKSSLFKWSNKMFNLFSVSRTCALNCGGALALTRFISAERIS